MATFARAWWSFGAFLLIMSVPSPASSDLLLSNIRYWTAPDHTRVVIDMSGGAQFAHRVLSGPNRIAVDINSADFQGSTRKMGVNDGLIRAIRMNELRSGKAQVVLDLEHPARYHIFLLDPIGEKPDRLVIDVFRDAPAAAPPPKAVHGDIRRVIIDAGHGGEDPGAIGLRKLREKDLTLDIAQRLARRIDAMPGYEPLLTRRGDYFLSLSGRSKLAREMQGDLFISIHANSARSKNARGFEIFFLSLSGATDKMARELAHKENAADMMGGVSSTTEDEVISILFDYLQEEGMKRSAVLAEQIYTRFKKDRDLSLRNVKQAGFAVLKSMQMPAVLVEVGFLSNREDAELLARESYRERIAGFLADGIEQYCLQSGGNGKGPGSLTGGGKGHGEQASGRQLTHVVKSGETAWSIASLYRVRLADLLSWNNLNARSVLLVGQKLRVN